HANPSSSTPYSKFLNPKKKLEIEIWLEDSKSVDPLVSMNDEIKDKIVKEEEVEEDEDDL
ncbi:hypothetical protein Tco_1049140, partial [Tanacetum coccineum]